MSRLKQLLRKHGIAVVPHGFRSAFSDWAAEEMDDPREIVEAALAHVGKSNVEVAWFAQTCSSGGGWWPIWAEHLAGRRAGSGR